ncbi:hypothetical protein FN846DRAFT_888553 [Sphaerosporella brunnea]|uniref:Uncharacterized protein n=1 Tax=Sphaerosporella brunnea TaxID=1250544 RepID=A0A5J5F2R0_9PEZI|nr:hypothetical protein FN846DRAFT_888553 [Sphaerosporella brunnea]
MAESHSMAESSSMAKSRSIEGCARADDAASGAPVAKGETPQATVPSPPTITASDTRNAERNARRIAQRKRARQQAKKATGETAVTLAPTSVRQKSGSIFVDCSKHTGMEIAWKPNDSGSGVAFTIRGSPEVLPAPSRSPPQFADTAAEERAAAGMEAVRPEVATGFSGSLPVTATTFSLRPGGRASLLLREYLEWYIALVVDDPERVDSIIRAGDILMEEDFDLMTIQTFKGSEWLLLGITLGIGLALQQDISAFLKSRLQGCRPHRVGFGWLGC